MINSAYQNQKISLLTKHGKELVIGEELSALDCQLIHIFDFDTDQLGNFTRGVPRAGSQIEAAHKKARIGMNLSKLPIGIASEGAFSADPVIGMMAWNTELVLLIDTIHDIELVGYADGKAQHSSKTVSSLSELMNSLDGFGFPEHYLVLRPDHANYTRFISGINSIKGLEDAFEWAMRESKTSSVFVENDLRAFANPTRMHNIAKATQQLVQKMRSYCPQCNSPGFWITKKIIGLPCRDCGEPTLQAFGNYWECPKCPFNQEERFEKTSSADPRFCNLCNP